MGGFRLVVDKLKVMLKSCFTSEQGLFENFGCKHYCLTHDIEVMCISGLKACFCKLLALCTSKGQFKVRLANHVGQFILNLESTYLLHFNSLLLIVVFAGCLLYISHDRPSVILLDEICRTKSKPQGP